MLCPDCKKENLESSQKCAFCGAPLFSISAQDQKLASLELKPNKINNIRNKIILAGGLICIAILTVGSYFFFFEKSSEGTQLSASKTENLAENKKFEPQKYLSICEGIREVEHVEKSSCYAFVSVRIDDFSVCEKTQYKDECLRYVALNKNDISICNEKIDNQESKDLCYKKFVERKDDESICEKIDNQNMKDYCYKTISFNKKDIFLCDKIQDQENRDKCYGGNIEDYYGKNILKDKILLDCEKIKDQDAKDKCYLNNAGVNIDLIVCEGIKNQDKKYDCYKTIAGEKQDLMICDKILNNDGKKILCYYDVIVKKQEILLCNKISNDQIKDKCISEIAKIKKDVSLCSNIKSKDICYSDVAEATSDVSLCDKIQDQKTKSSCYWDVAITKPDVFLCDKSLNLNIESCYEQVAEKTSDISICEKIEDQYYKSKCYNNIVQTKDLPMSVCDKMPVDNNERYSCYSVRAVEEKDSSICDRISDKDKKEACNINYLIQGEKPPLDICDRIKGFQGVKNLQEYKDQCFMKLAFTKQDPLFCYKKSSQESIDYCLGLFFYGFAQESIS